MLPKALKSNPKCKKAPNLVTLKPMDDDSLSTTSTRLNTKARDIWRVRIKRRWLRGGKGGKTIFSIQAIPGHFFFIFDFSKQFMIQLIGSKEALPMAGFEPRINGVGSKRSNN